MAPKIKVCILDFDDTLLPSHHIHSISDISLISTELSLLDNHLINLFDTLAIFRYNIYIITNSETGWVELASSKYLPKVKEYLVNSNVPIISARSTYEYICPGNPPLWKELAFMHLAKKAQEGSCEFTVFQMDDEIYSNEISPIEILSIGDSLSEKEAAKSLAINCSNSCPIIVKTIKMIERPSIYCIIDQLTHIINNISNISNDPVSTDSEILIHFSKVSSIPSIL